MVRSGSATTKSCMKTVNSTKLVRDSCSKLIEYLTYHLVVPPFILIYELAFLIYSNLTLTSICTFISSSCIFNLATRLPVQPYESWASKVGCSTTSAVESCPPPEIRAIRFPASHTRIGPWTFGFSSRQIRSETVSFSRFSKCRCNGTSSVTFVPGRTTFFM